MREIRSEDSGKQKHGFKKTTNKTKVQDDIRQGDAEGLQPRTHGLGLNCLFRFLYAPKTVTDTFKALSS